MSTVSYTFDAKFDVDVPLLIVGAGAAPAHCFIPKAVSRSTAPVVSGAKTGHCCQIYLPPAARLRAYQARARPVICPAMVF
jgi:hypothetical protein